MKGSDNDWYLENENWLSNITSGQYQEKLVAWCEQKSISYIDLTESFRKATNKDALNYRLDTHWTEHGHSLAAQVLFKILNKSNLLGLDEYDNRLYIL